MREKECDFEPKGWLGRKLSKNYSDEVRTGSSLAASPSSVRYTSCSFVNLPWSKTEALSLLSFQFHLHVGANIASHPFIMAMSWYIFSTRFLLPVAGQVLAELVPE
jgi:hypothetical protein